MSYTSLPTDGAVVPRGPAATPGLNMMTDDNALSVKEVFEHRAMYDAVVDGNYMRHAELTAALAAWSAAFAQPLRVLDLGCGDSLLATAGFRDANVERYLGVDLAESSIEMAYRRVAIWPGRTELVCGDLFATLETLPDKSANVVLASYSLHHFATADKRRLVSEIARLLEPRGFLLWIDAVREEGESRDCYIERLTNAIAYEWTTLTAEERQLAIDHVRSADFPETRLAHDGGARRREPAG